MLSKQEEQLERRETLDNDRLVREQGGSTFLAHTHNDVGGRFAAVSSPQVIGSVPSPASQYTAGPNWCAADQELEPPTGIDINAMEPVGQPHELKASSLEPTPAQASPGRSSRISSFVQATTNPAPSPLTPPLVGERAGLGSFTTFRRR